MIEPFRLRLPRESDRVPVVFDSPHSGRYYPPKGETAPYRTEHRKVEGAHVDELLDGAVAYGIAVLDATYAKSCIDLDRAVKDADPERVASVFAPYHAALDSLIESALAKFGVVWHINWHSEESDGAGMRPDGSGAQRVDACVSDADGTTASPEVTRFVAYTIRGLGMRVAVNQPCQTGDIVRRIGAPSRRVHSVEVRLNRGLFLDEQSGAKTTGFVALARVLEVVARELGVVAMMQAR